MRAIYSYGVALVIAETLVFERMEGWLFGIFASLALALAMVGLYGLVSHEVEQATRDIGVRAVCGEAPDATAEQLSPGDVLSTGLALGVFKAAQLLEMESSAVAFTISPHRS